METLESSNEALRPLREVVSVDIEFGVKPAHIYAYQAFLEYGGKNQALLKASPVDKGKSDTSDSFTCMVEM
jgi:hypothetical protein